MTRFAHLSLAAVALTLTAGIAQSSAAPLSSINRSSPIAIRSYLTPYQPTTKSMGFYAPWAVKNPYGMKMLGTPAQRAVACGC